MYVGVVVVCWGCVFCLMLLLVVFACCLLLLNVLNVVCVFVPLLFVCLRVGDFLIC